MRRTAHSLLAASLGAAVLLAAWSAPVAAQALLPDYRLTTPALRGDAELAPRASLVTWGSLRLLSGDTPHGSGLSLEAGENWFARAGIGRTLDSDVLSVGGGYRFSEAEAVTMQVTRQFGQERLGLAVRYDWRRTYLRLSYEQPLRTPGAADRLRFSAGVRF